MMATTFSSNESITGYITNISQENKKKKYYIKFTMQSENNKEIDGWIFSGIAGILTTPLGLALSNAMENHTGLRIWGKIEESNGLTVFKTQSWANFQKLNPGFLFEKPPIDILSIRDALMSIELSSIRVFIIDIRLPEQFEHRSIRHTNTFVLVGDQTGTCYLAATDLLPNTLLIEHTYDLNQIRRKMFNGVPVLCTTINTRIVLSNTSVNADLGDIQTTLAIDLCNTKKIISTIEEIGTINRSNSCSTCKGDLANVEGAAALVYCHKCQRHSLKKNIDYNISSTIIIKNGTSQSEEKILLWVSGPVLQQLLNVVNLTPAADDTEIAVALLSNIELCFEYTELQRELLAISKP